MASTPGCTARITLHLVGPGSWTEVAAGLAYHPDDPHAVRIRFGIQPGTDGDDAGGVEWMLGRDLVHAGLTHPTGAGDVRLWPARTAVDVLFLELRSPSGYALFELARSVVADFLRDTERLVPRGAESDLAAVGEELQALLQGGSPEPGR